MRHLNERKNGFDDRRYKELAYIDKRCKYVGKHGDTVYDTR